MKLHVLGCAGGIGGQQRFTTCLRVDDDILLDAGTGVTNLDVEQLAAIDHVFLTHSHLDHVAGLALLADSVVGRRSTAVTVHASGDVIAALQQHLFNWVLWPDFSVIPSAQAPVLRWAPFVPGEAIRLGARTITSHPVNHMPGAVAYRVQNERDGFLFSGDMSSTPELWRALLEQHRLSTVVVDCSFPNGEAELARKSMHFCPQALLDDIAAMPHATKFLIYHLKPGQEDAIMAELKAAAGGRPLRALQCGDTFTF
ncbi:3',5'-cyclic-nucleotide phosphodiesterase [Noviherbaspirillum autotrophicum]|uniref:Metallo-beta-lactamase domain-containing protein n=1 Tax=Noviherbaspirillum autotrophicum TaxID=709839 RepID=A0A0C2BZR3_9BURK|nr:3',5'-cyclic-nucleotide phosphodiesterase [Noviherbaspirillum autotrophicum]KIF83531.1 hypothetical protein TSA66_06345 [Noviherbaspirillum autotrophicum]